MEDTAFLIPSTTKHRSWLGIKQSYLYKSLKHLSQYYKGLTIYVGYDGDDLLYVHQLCYLIEDIPEFKFKLIKYHHNEPGNVVYLWNDMCKRAIQDQFEYLYIIGDDISYPTNNGWLETLKNGLKKNDNIGYSAGDSGNPKLPMTQFLIHRKHYEMFNFVFNPMLKNWYCDNYLNELYQKKYINYYPDIKLINCGGTPRYQPCKHQKLYKMLVKRDRAILNKFIN